MIPIRGDATVKHKEHLNKGNIVEIMHIGNTTVQIADDYCARTSETIEQVLEQYHHAGWAILESLAAKKALSIKENQSDETPQWIEPKEDTDESNNQ